MPLTTGTKLGPYEIVSPLGAGGMGEVYRAKDTRLDREVAIKVLPERLANDADALAREKNGSGRREIVDRGRVERRGRERHVLVDPQPFDLVEHR